MLKKEMSMKQYDFFLYLRLEVTEHCNIYKYQYNFLAIISET